MTGKTAPINAGERQWIEAWIKVAHDVARVFGIVEDGGALTPAVLDTVYAQARSNPPPDIGPNDLVNAVGLAYGQYIVDHCSFEWAAYTEHGQTDIAVHRKEGDIIVCPTNLVGKRYAAGATHFLAPTYEDMLRVIARIDAPKKRPWWKPGKA